MGGNRNTSGFTVIETMLFLAISGLLVVTLLAGTGVSISIQRYRDAVETFKATLQEQYSELASVKNERDDTWSCNDLAQTEEQGNATARGQSDCSLVGRYVTIVGGKITKYSVVAHKLANLPTAENDIEKMTRWYTLNVSTVNKEESEMEWGTAIAWPTTPGEGVTRNTNSGERSLALLFIRSPDSGLIYTFASNKVTDEPSPQALKNVMLESVDGIAPQRERVVCVDASTLFQGESLAVVIRGFATGPSGIETESNELRGQNGIQC